MGRNKYSQKEFDKIWKAMYRKVKPARKPVQKRLTPYTPKLFGEKKTYPQDWPMYAKATSQEKLMFLRILKDVTEELNIPYEYKGKGRPSHYLGDIIKSLCIKSYHGYSSWRTESDLKICKAMGIIDYVPKRSTLLRYLQDKRVTNYLHKIYKLIAEPLAEIEVYFAADSSGFGNAYGSLRWMTIRHTKKEKKHSKDYSKINIISGIKTNVVCSAIVTRGKKHESPFLKPLLDDTAKIFTIKELSADSGYLSKKNAKAVYKVGGVPFIMPKKTVNVVDTGRITPWNGMLRFWKYHQMFFAEHYHKRSNVEATFSMIKKKFGGFCRCKKPISQENEILCKVVCHNACVLAEALLSYDLRKGFLTKNKIK